MRHLAIAVFAITFPLSHAAAQPFPAKPLRMVVPTAPSGSADIMGRLAAEHLQKRLGQPVVVENRPGASGVIAVSAGVQIRGALAGLHLSVMNTAGDAGIPDAEHVFKKYWRGPGATRCAGSGLGLYLSSLIANRLGGELRYRPENSTVRFELWLPI